MKQAVIVDCIRTPMGRSKQGCFRHTRAETLSAELMKHLLKRNPAIAAEQVEDIYWGCVQQTLEQGFNVARNAALLAGLPFSIGAVTVNRLCGSSMQALHDAARAIACGDGEIMMVGGVEHMGHVPMTHGADFHPGLSKTTAKAAAMMGLTAELLAKQYRISRKQMDHFAARSHQRAHQATLSGAFAKEIVAITGHDQQGGLGLIEQDEVIRPDTQVENLALLPPVFDPINGKVTAGSSSALSDGAAAMLVMSEQKAQQLGLPIRVKIRAMAIAGCEPSMMGFGPVPASQKALQRANLSIDQIDLFEFNEAFAAQVLPCIEALGLNHRLEDSINLHGGAIALGHPLGCSGARITTTLINLMEQRDVHLGLASMCIGLGQGITTIFERS